LLILLKIKIDHNIPIITIDELTNKLLNLGG